MYSSVKPNKYNKNIVIENQKNEHFISIDKLQ